MTSEELDAMELLLEQAVEGKAIGPDSAWCQTQLNILRAWRGHYDVVAPGQANRLGQLTMLVRFAMPLHPTA